MVFLNPSILLGLLAASIPILIHILNFRKLRKVEFSTLAFLKELQKSKIKKIKIKQWLLLLLRILIIVFLVLAFARPTLESITIVKGTSSAKTSAVFIIDNSFSMNYIGNEGSLFNKSKKTAVEIISQMEDGDEFIFLVSIDSIITFSNKTSAINFLNNYNVQLLTEQTNDRIEKATLILNKSKNINKEIYLFSDYQQSTFNGQNELDTLFTPLSSKNVYLYSFDFSIENPANYSINNLNLENSIIELNKPLTFSALVNNFSNNSINDIRISLFLNNKRVAQKNINLQAQSEKSVLFQTSLSELGLNEAWVELEEDNILQDNKNFFNFFVPPVINVLLIYQNEADILFVEKAIKSSSTSDQIKISKTNWKQLNMQSLSGYNMLIWIGSKYDSSINLNQYLRDGGNLLFIPPAKLDEKELKTLKNAINLPDFQRIVSTDLNQLNYTEFGEINFQHPVFATLFENNRKEEIESPDIFKYIKFVESLKINSIIKLIDGTIFLGQYSLGKGKVIFFNTSASLEWSNFPIKGIFAPLITRIIYYMSNSSDTKENYIIGDKIPIDISEITFPIIDINLPQGNEKLNIENKQEKTIQYSNTKQPGSYRFYNNDNLIDFAAVNTNPIESNLTKANIDSVQQYYESLFGNNYFIFGPEDNFFEKIKQARYGTELWSYFLILALIFALIEMFVARSSKKDLVSLNS